MSDSRRNWALFLAVSMFLGITTGIYETSFNNYLSDVFQISAKTRGWLEFPREFPGCSIAFISAVLAFLPEVKMAIVATGLWALGLFGLGALSPSLPVLIIWMMVWSVGTHLYLALGQAIGVSVSEEDQVGRRLGQIAGVNTAAIIAGAGVVWLSMEYWNLGYAPIFAIAAASAFLAALSLIPMKVQSARRSPGELEMGTPGIDMDIQGSDLRQPHRFAFTSRFVVKRRYGLFYALNILFGARKQVFITFGPWVLIRVFEQPASTIAMLWIVSSVLGIFFKPLLGRLIDSWGERRILMGEAACLVLICLGYASGGRLGALEFGNIGVDMGLYLTYACFIADQLLMGVGIARTTYLNKIAEDPRDLTPTLSLGISLDHVVSMMVPAFGGILWAQMGYEYVFVVAACVALLNLLVAGHI